MKNNVKTLLRSVSIAFCLLVTSYCYSQTIHGSVQNTTSKSPIGYVNIGIVGKNVGTVSDEKGNFVIELNDQYDKDTLKFSMIGFKNLQFVVGNFKKDFLSKNGNIQIDLAQNITFLNEVIIKPKKYSTKIIGNTTNSSSIVGGFTSNDLGSELGTVMKIKKSPAFIENVNFNIAVNKYDSITFRINIYKMRNGIPVENIFKNPLFVTTKIKKGTLSIDLRKYNLIVEDTFLVSIEWIKDLKGSNLYFSGGFLNQDSYSRKTSQGNWKKVTTIGIGIYSTVTYEIK